MNKFVCAPLCCALICLIFAGCQGDSASRGKIIRYDIPAAITNLDPQFATDAWSRMIIGNTREGLLTRGENGDLVPGVAESWAVSGDSKTYTFKLRGDARYKDGSPVTAHDFVFAFRRMFSPSSPSPFAEDYISVAGAAEMLAGTLTADRLGVTAKGDYELEIRLVHPSPYFPDVLAETPATPCNEDFFNESRGRYGLNKSSVDSNGPFYVERWDNDSAIQLRPNPEYAFADSVLSAGVNLHITDEDPVARLRDGASDAAAVSYSEAERLKEQGFSVSYFDSTVWCIVFNQASPNWGNPLLRQGLAHSIEQGLLTEQLPQRLTPVMLPVPPTSTFAGENYRRHVDAVPIAFDPERGRRLFEMGLKALGIDKVYEDMLYVPDSADHLLAIGMVQQSWQKHLSAYITVEPADSGEIWSRFSNGDFAMLLLPLSSTTDSGGALLSMFSSDSPDNRFGYHNTVYDNLLKAAATAESVSEAADAFGRAESLLLHDAVVIPVYTEAAAFAISPAVTGLMPSAYPAGLKFHHAER